MARKIEVEIVGDASSYKRALGQAQGSTSKFGKMAKAALVGGVAAGLYTLGKAAKIGWDEYNQGAQVAAQTNAVIESTGGVANVTAKEVEELGHQLMLKSGIDDEVIKSGENVLLTFKNIRDETGKGNDIFKQATEATLDLSVAMDKDMASASVMVGKALNDPIKGLTSLTRVGVQFSDKQRQVIERLVESGDKMGAQKVILKELRSEFGKSAEAAGDTFGGKLKILRERLNNFLGDLTEKAIPIMERFLDWVGPKAREALKIGREAVKRGREAWARLGEVLERHQPTIDKVRSLIENVTKVIKPLIKWEIFLYSTIWKVWMAILDVILTVTDKVIGAVEKMAGGVKTAAGAIKNAFNAVKDVVMSVVGAIQALIGIVGSARSSLSQGLHLPSLPDPTPGFDVPGVPIFARGGVMPGPRGRHSLAMVAGGETILPTHRGGAAMTVNVVLDGRILGRALVDLERRQARSNGGLGFLTT